MRKRGKIGQLKKLAQMVLKKRKVEVAGGRHLDITQDNRVAFSEIARKHLQLPEVKSKRSYERDELSVNEFYFLFW